MTEKRLNNLLFLHIHKDLPDDLDMSKVLNSFCFAKANATGPIARFSTLENKPGGLNLAVLSIFLVGILDIKTPF